MCTLVRRFIILLWVKAGKGVLPDRSLRHQVKVIPTSKYWICFMFKNILGNAWLINCIFTLIYFRNYPV